jgi:hypothetical protein
VKRKLFLDKIKEITKTVILKKNLWSRKIYDILMESYNTRTYSIGRKL